MFEIGFLFLRLGGFLGLSFFLNWEVVLGLSF